MDTQNQLKGEIEPNLVFNEGNHTQEAQKLLA